MEDFEEWQRLRRTEGDDQVYGFLLINKANGKELDRRHFSSEERKVFDERDAKEWTSWIDNKVVRRLNDEEIKALDYKDVFRAPARMIRVNKAALHGGFQPKSRFLDPHPGSFRSDASRQLGQQYR